MSEIWVLVDKAQDTVRNVTYEVLSASKLKEKMVQQFAPFM